MFLNDARAALIAADAAIVVVDAVSGVEPQTEKMWNTAEEFKLPRAIVINKLDRDRASFERTMESIHARFGRAAVPIQLPLGSEKDFRGVIDLIRMKAYVYTLDGDGKGQETEIPGRIRRGGQARPRGTGRSGGRGQRRPDGGVLREGHASRRTHHQRHR